MRRPSSPCVCRVGTNSVVPSGWMTGTMLRWRSDGAERERGEEPRTERAVGPPRRLALAARRLRGVPLPLRQRHGLLERQRADGRRLRAERHGEREGGGDGGKALHAMRDGGDAAG